MISLLLTKFQVSKKFSSDVLWNIGSFCVMGLSGVLLNVLIARFFALDILGGFNQVFSIYILFSQFAVCGIHLSVVKYLSEITNKDKNFNNIIFSALISVSIIAFFVCLIVFQFIPFIGELLNSLLVRNGLYFVLPGLWFFSLNKVLIAVLNGNRRMKAFAFFQAARYIFIVSVIIFCIMMHWNGEMLPIVFTIAELILFICLFLYVFFSMSLYFPKKASFNNDLMFWFKKHVIFGTKAFLGGALGEINTRVDVLMLGVFCSDHIVGIYSFAAILVEGIAQFMFVFRANVNPIISRLFINRELEKLKYKISRGIRLFYCLMIVVGVIATIVYPFCLEMFIKNNNYNVSWVIFSILMFGVMCSSGYYPFNMILTQTGFAGYNTIFIGCIVLTNALLNLLLIPSFGMYGAAIATSIAFVCSIFYLKIFVRKLLKIRI